MYRVIFGLAIVGFLAFLSPVPSTLASHPKDFTDVKIDGSDPGWFCSIGFFGSVCETDVNVGATVTWNFLGFFTHTTTECGADCDFPTATPLWDSGTILGGTFEYTFDTPGVYKYRCNMHPGTMRGQITVSGSVGGVAELDSAAGAGLDALERDSGASSTGTAIAVATVVALVASLAGAAWYTRRRVGQEGRSPLERR